MRVTIFNQKGGVGKTTVAIHLARALGPRTLLIDLDPQATATQLLGLGNANDGIYDALEGIAGLASIVVDCDWGFAVAPATIDLAGFERERLERQESRLVELLNHAAYPSYSNVVIDCPPGVGFLAQNALVASDKAVIVTEPNFPSLMGLAAAIESVSVIHDHYNSRLAFAGIVLNKVLQTSEAKYRLGEVEEALGKEQILCRIPQRAAIAEAAGLLEPCTHPALTGPIDDLKERLLNG
ncbi:MAG: ParA family protein [Actinomycetota bacterium]|nr:ParA family protein [Actinomycetota bacterium]